jgi:hypothetical protein
MQEIVGSNHATGKLSFALYLQFYVHAELYMPATLWFWVLIGYDQLILLFIHSGNHTYNV